MRANLLLAPNWRLWTVDLRIELIVRCRPLRIDLYQSLSRPHRQEVPGGKRALRSTPASAGIPARAAT
jgi:hypothetical protein